MRTTQFIARCSKHFFASIFLAATIFSPAQNTIETTLRNAPAWLPLAYRHMISIGIPNNLNQTIQAGDLLPQLQLDTDTTGVLATYQTTGTTNTVTNAFFQPLGANGRTCATCHQPANAMSISAASATQRLWSTLGTDPLFAPVDAANCPSNAGPAILFPFNYSLLLNYGLFRIALPVPQNAEYTVSVVSDPYGCNVNSTYNQVSDPATGIKSQILSVYRRSLMAANLGFKVITGADTGQAPPIDLVTGLPLATDPTTGQFESGNIMSDGREPTLTSQAIDAVLTHAQGMKAPTPAQLAQIVAFESTLYSAQYSDRLAGPLTTGGINGGPIVLSKTAPGYPAAASQETIAAYDALNPALHAQTPSRASIYRGQQLFNNKIFTISNDAGINNIPGVPNGIPSTCSGCHSQVGGTTETFPQGQHTIGIGGLDANLNGPPASTYLPIFKFTCKSGYATPFTGSVVYLNDPGKALITGKCADLGRFSTPQLHGLAARAPYFHDGSVADLTSVVNFYNRRFSIGLTAQNTADLVAFLNTL